MDKEILKKALIKGIITGLICVCIIFAVEILIFRDTFKETVCSVSGILMIICIPLAEVLAFYQYYKKKK